jgi:OOP family OmpA-OmpF porin
MLRRPTLHRGAALAGIVLLAAMSVGAQTQTPSADQMIEQLKGPRTRSLRNLTVEAAAPGTAAPIASTNASANAPTTAATTSSSAADSPAVRPSLSLLIQFDFNSATVRPESQQALANLSQALQSSELVSFKFAVEGHTDAKGSAGYNQKLSQSRAGAVRDFLVAQGVATDRLTAAGKGSSDLANRAEPFAPENRRVRIVNLD